MKLLIFILIGFLNGFLYAAVATENLDDTDFTFEEDPPNDVSQEDGSGSAFFSTFILDPLRFSLIHEGSFKFEAPEDIQNNRSSLRLEYSKFFLNYFYLQFDTKLNAFWGNDHRAEAIHEGALLETVTREAFLQVSFAQTSIKAGYQVLIWGESDGGAVTDVISPRDYSEAFFIPLEESRIGQFMIGVDQFTMIGDWNLFFIPFPDFNEYPKKGTAYYYDPFDGRVVYEHESSDKNLFEYGLRWKKTFGNSDISIMGASLISNNYAYRLEGFDSNGNTLMTKVKQRYTLAGMTFNYVFGNFMLKGEVGYKSPKSFNNSAFEIIEKDVVDSALGLLYSPGGNFTLSLEGVNSHVLNWNNEIQGASEDSYSLVLVLGNSFFNDNLTVRWMSIYGGPSASFLHTLWTSYKWSDNLTFYLNFFYPFVEDKKSGYWTYRDQKQIVFKTQLQF